MEEARLLWNGAVKTSHKLMRRKANLSSRSTSYDPAKFLLSVNNTRVAGYMATFLKIEASLQPLGVKKNFGCTHFRFTKDKQYFFTRQVSSLWKIQ